MKGYVWVYVTNLDEYESIGTRWIASYVNPENVKQFYHFGVEHIPKEIRKFIGNINVITNIYAMRISNVQILLYCIYWFHLER